MDYLKILHQYWGYPDFRGIQREIIELSPFKFLRLQKMVSAL